MPTRRVNIEVEAAIRQAVSEGLVGIGNQLEAFVAGMDIGAKGDLQRAHVKVAAEMRSAVRAAYGSRVNLREPMRRSGRLSGALGRVINRNDLARATPQGIEFLREDVFNKEAAHWGRINFGAGAAAGDQEAPVPLRIFGEEIGTASLAGRASPAFSLPKGYFIEDGRARMPNPSFRGGGGTSNFIPNRRSPYTPAVTAGIRGSHFLERGLDAAAKELPIQYTNMLNDWVARGGRKARAVESVIRSRR